jgi:hypothetical protein
VSKRPPARRRTALLLLPDDATAQDAFDPFSQWRLSPNVTLGAAWDGIFGNEGQDHTITGRLKIAF